MKDDSIGDEVAVRASEMPASTRRQAERRPGARLQHLFLPAALPHVDGVDLAVRYRSAQAGTEDGGDFYDAVLLPSGRLGVVIGDVEGHDSGAAAVMGQLRAAIRALAGQHHEPAAVLDALAWSWPLLGFNRTATVCAARIDLEDGSMVVVSAGHPPPLLCRRDGHVEYLPVEPTPPLGAPSRPAEQLATGLGPGDAVVLYTDGVVERRGQPLADRLQALADACSTFPPGTDIEGWCDDVLGRLGPSGDDDSALLVIRRRDG